MRFRIGHRIGRNVPRNAVKCYDPKMLRVARWGSAALLALPFVLMAVLLPWPLADRAATIALAALAVVALYGLHRWLMYAEGRGWIYYRKARGSSGALAATSEWLNMYAPSRRHVIETLREPEWKRDEDDDGDEPASGRS